MTSTPAGLPEPDLYVEMPDGRRVAVDDRGDPAGRPVLFFHGTPDTRVARHPDDGIAVGLGIRLVAVDRPGLGASDIDSEATPRTVADDHARVLDYLGIERAGVFAWSAGTIAALAFAGWHPARTTRTTLVAPLIPADGYSHDGVLHGADDSRRLFADVLATTSPDEAGRELALWLVPTEVDDTTARAMLAESIAAVRHVAGAGDALVAALVGSVHQGLRGLEREITAQATILGSILDGVASDGAIHVGARDPVTPPAMARWLGRRLGLPVTVHPDQGHLLAIEQWAELLAEAAQPGSAGPESADPGTPGSGASGSTQSI